MAKNVCVVCGGSQYKLVVGVKHPERKVCLDCLNDIIFNINTVEEELEPLAKALENAFGDLQKELEKRQK